ncbi:MAG: cyclic nucleotide-binding domain-containing protein [Thermodesulfobacteriota bacterium]
MYKFLSEQTYENDHVIFDEGSQDEFVYVVLSGAVKIIKELRGEFIVVEVMRQGEIFGEMAFVAGIPRTATAKAMGRTMVGILDPAAMDQEFELLSPVMRKIMENLVLRLKKATENSIGVSFLRRQPRVCKTISVAYDNGCEFLETTTRDASIGGLFLKTERPLVEGEVFNLHLKLGDKEAPVLVQSQVAWVRTHSQDQEKFPLGMGVRFLRLSKEDHNRLKKALG